jgi:acyl-CoA synthetase (AMP-forming)/AMP-acid ligase II
LISVLRRRSLEPTPTGAEKAALIGKAEQEGRLRKREVKPPEILLGEFPARVVEQLDEGRRFLLEAPLQSALAHAQLARNLVALRLTEEQIIAHCRRERAAYKVPKEVRCPDALPKSAVGKILRKDLRDPLMGRQAS